VSAKLEVDGHFSGAAGISQIEPPRIAADSRAAMAGTAAKLQNDFFFEYP
jgi:hypothetical protein